MIKLHSDAKTVDEYIENLTSERRDAILLLRKIMKKVASRAVESMKFGIPTYYLGEKYFTFASQKQYISLYIQQFDLISKYSSKFEHVSAGKSCLRFRRFKYMRPEIIQQLLEDSVSATYFDTK